MCVPAFICVTWAFSLAFLFSCFVFLSYSGVFVCLFYVPILKEKEREWICMGGDARRIREDSEAAKQ